MKKTEDKKTFVVSNIVSTFHLHQRRQIKTKFMQLRIYFNVAGQVHIFKKSFYKTWTFDCSSPQYSGEMVYQIMHCSKKNISKALRQKLVEWIMKNSNVCESPIAHDTLLITDAESRVKRRVPKLLLECFMRQLRNELITSPDDAGLLGSRHDNTNDVIISYTVLRSLSPPQLRPITDHCKMMCGCAICNTSKYFQESLNPWWRGKLKTMKDKADNSLGNKNMNQLKLTNHMLTTHFQNNENRHPRCENAADYVLCTLTNDECQLPNWKCVLWKCTACNSIALPGFEIDLSNRAPMLTFNTYMTPFTCSQYGIPTREKITTYLDAKITYKKTYIFM